jgi:hypothetical protein
MTKTIENLLVFLAIYTPLLPVILFFIFYKKARNQKIFFFLIAYSFIEFSINVIANNLDESYILSLYAVFTVLEYLLFASLLYTLVHSEKIRVAIKIASIGFLIFISIYYLSVQLKSLDSIPIGIETVLVLGYSFLFLYEEMELESQILIYNRFSFWIVSGIMIYLGGSFFIYVFANQVDNATKHTFWAFQNVFSIIKNILFSLSIYIYYKKALLKNIKKPFHYDY